MTIRFRTGYRFFFLSALSICAVLCSATREAAGQGEVLQPETYPFNWESESSLPDPMGSLPPPCPCELGPCELAGGCQRCDGTITLKASWQNGLLLESADRHTRVRIGGRVQADGTWYQGNDALQSGPDGLGNLQDAVNFRRARFRIDGTMYETVDWATEFDFVNATNTEPFLAPQDLTAATFPATTDLWLTLTQVPVVGNVRMGNMKEPIGMEHLTSSRFLDFMERSFMQDAFYGPFNNGFTPGIMLFNWDDTESVTWALGGFKNTSNIFGSGVGDGEYAVTGRMTALPLYLDDGRRLVHVGLAGSHRSLDEGRVRIRSRASLRSGTPGPYNPILADTGMLLGDSQTLLASEFAAVDGPLTLQAEYTASLVEDAVSPLGSHGTYVAQGWYAQALWFLSGEHRAYNRRAGVFDRVVPIQNCHPHRSAAGAWQVGIRYAQLDLRNAGIDAEIIQDVTLGLNWFLNPNAKVQWNYVWAERDTAANDAYGTMHGFGTRLAYDF